MWIFTRHGFVSIVPCPEDADKFMVRARRSGHLKALFPGEQVYKVSATRYWWRVFVARDEAVRVIAAEMRAIDYPAFRLSLTDADYYDVCDLVAKATEMLQSPFSPFEQQMGD